ncbi:BspA family leucine-rich repeat surface protein [Elizabethkingia ursingii]|uniref:BspA family leucine-rich repeat surface protein n=1 Tax=Elizabethkingia ursingii TaxID=1756150 RepID=UPI0020115BFD|nr:BspA family leucine-rich repeat surface protein [Elizabethkingia ursingii]MCL1673612.1 BspA family leucine-rich repeat surface protein [Elizabethkingia ursingii]
MNTLVLKSPGKSLKVLPLAEHMNLRITRTSRDNSKFLHMRFTGLGLIKISGGKFYESLDDQVGKTEWSYNGGELGLLVRINEGLDEAMIHFPDGSPMRWRIRYGSGYLSYDPWSPGVPKVDWTSNLYNLWSLTSQFQWIGSMSNQPIYGIKHVPDYNFGGGCYNMFNGCTEFNEEVECLDTRNYIDFRIMFNDCWKFNKPVGKLNVKSAQFMGEMFRACSSFNQPLNGWGDLSHVLDFDAMFFSAGSFDQDLSFIKFNLDANIGRMLQWSGIGPENYGKFLKNLDSLDFTGRTTPKVLNADGLFYDPKYKSSRDSLIGKGWSIMDAGVITYTIV